MRTFRILALALCIALIPSTATAADCEFRLGFKTIRDLIGHDIVGECGENERYNSIGDSVQQTTGGLLVWRKADNWTAFTDGHRTWINGPNGLVQRHINERFKWELDYAPGGLSIINCRSQRVVTETTLNLGASPPATTQEDEPAPSLVALARAAGWYRDGVAYGIRSPEGEVLTVLEKIDSNSPHIARVASNWEWLFDEDMLWQEWHVIEFIARLDDYVPVYVPRLLALPWIHDGVDEFEAEAVRFLYREALCYGLDFAVQLATAPWVLDGIDAAEFDALATVRNLSEGAHRIIPALFQKPWMRDGLTEVEMDALHLLLYMSENFERQDEASALAILDMPFLNDSIDQSDISVLRSLNGLRHGFDRSYLGQVLSHPSLSDGITVSDMGLVAFLGHVVSKNPESHHPELLDILLDPAQTAIEVRGVSLPRAGNVLVTVVRPYRLGHTTLALLEQAMRVQEEFMLEAYPRTLLTLLLADVDKLDELDVRTDTAFLHSADAQDDFSIASVVAQRYWWTPFPAWIAGGGLLMLSVATLYPTSLHSLTFDLKCETGVSIDEMERRERNLESESEANKESVHFCLYDLGLAMFLDLYSDLGDQQFRQGFQRLYLKLRDEAHEDLCLEDNRGVCYVKAAFVTDAEPHSAAIAELIINRWYYGSEHGPQ